jgi:protein TonB
MAVENGIQGSVVCRFTVVEDGSISDIEILKSLDRYTDEEAVRLIQSMPQWTIMPVLGKNPFPNFVSVATNGKNVKAVAGRHPSNIHKRFP